MKHLRKIFLICCAIIPIFFSCNDDDSFPLHDGSNTPDYFINLVLKDSIIYNNVYTEFSINANTNFTKAVYYIDDKFIDSVKVPPYRLRYRPSSLSPGKHKIMCEIIFPSLKLIREQNIESKLKIGEIFQGGTIFYLEDDELNGLVAAGTYLKNISWGADGIIGARDVDGSINTIKMIETADSSSKTAAYYFKDGYKYGNYSDWYIPSIEELAILKENKKIIRDFKTEGDTLSNFYFSSSENDSTNAYGFRFDVEDSDPEAVSKNTKANIRPIRKITH